MDDGRRTIDDGRDDSARGQPARQRQQQHRSNGQRPLSTRPAHDSEQRRFRLASSHGHSPFWSCLVYDVSRSASFLFISPFPSVCFGRGPCALVSSSSSSSSSSSASFSFPSPCQTSLRRSPVKPPLDWLRGGNC